ncbi:MAG: hypothetical protein A2X77_01255 [Gammaproteobacteria bacterium GWE2_42_36]|nr:MAG: hypothetical protein A2X77_01255 [Gammaproteobacteria bacterium GWE2_42_36]
MNAIEQQLLDQRLLDIDTLQQIKINLQGKSLLCYLADKKIISAAHVSQLLSNILQLPIVPLAKITRDENLLSLLPYSLLEEALVLPISRAHMQLDLAMADPSDRQTINTVQFLTGCVVQPLLVNFDELKQCIRQTSTSYETQLLHHYSTTQQRSTVALAQESIDLPDEPVVKFINYIVDLAVQKNASDIHVEIYATDYRIRFRQNGLLYEITKPPRELAQRLIARLKIMANLNIAEKRIAQDGHCKIVTSQKISMDIRVNSCPTLYGEKMVLRLLNSDKKLRNLETIHLLDHQKKLLTQAIHQPHGLILITGPTGSGKTMTLYAILQALNSSEKNISTVEDPVEIHLSGVNQVEINPKAGLTFANTLRAFLRQDPDIIMVGEIRDTETADIAIRAAQTGRLVLSTLHTNHALGTLTRLRNMHIEPYNIASAITLVTAQRLVRKLCPYCKQPQSLPSKIIQQFALDPDLPYFQASGCDQCEQGYAGRLAIHELLPLHESLISDYLMDPTQKNITPYFMTLQQTALEQVKAGIISWQEAARIVFDRGDDMALC